MRPFGIMFHHFHDGKCHIQSQGAIDDGQFARMIRFLEGRYRILDPGEWMGRALDDDFCGNEICLTFDDNLKCQFNVAVPVLEDFELKAFWFVYTSPLVGIMETLEVFRHFRFKVFDTIECFYTEFFGQAVEMAGQDSLEGYRKKCEESGYGRDCSLYTPDDRLFRFLRDVVFGPKDYNEIMQGMMARHNYNPEMYRNDLWMTADNLRYLQRNGHEIGLHSHSHPTNIVRMSREEQLSEYATNYKMLQETLGICPRSVSYPCGYYNEDTRDAMRELKVDIGFDAVMKTYGELDLLHFPRLDHAALWKTIEESA